MNKNNPNKQVVTIWKNMPTAEKKICLVKWKKLIQIRFWQIQILNVTKV